MNFKTIKDYLKNVINNRWYVFAKEDYNIDGKFIDCILLDKDTLKIITEEEGKIQEKIINYYWDYSLEQLYNIWQEI
jgi:hypoxanthine phosphoribosyltransferase